MTKLTSLNPQLLTKEQTASLLGVSLSTLNRYISQQLIPIVKVGNLVRFDKDVINNLFPPKSK